MNTLQQKFKLVTNFIQKGFRRKSIYFCELYPLAIMRELQLRVFFYCDWIVEQVSEVDTETCNATLESMQEALENKNSDLISQCLNEMQGVISDKVSNFHVPFITQHRESSGTFAFWTYYINVILLLLDYMRAVSAVTEMLPDHQNCAKWFSVDIVDMNLVEQSSAETRNTCCQSIK